MTLAIAHVDDVGLARSSRALVEFLFAELKKRKVNCAVENDLACCSSCEILFDKTGTKAWLGQPHFLSDAGTLPRNIQLDPKVQCCLAHTFCKTPLRFHGQSLRQQRPRCLVEKAQRMDRQHQHPKSLPFFSNEGKKNGHRICCRPAPAPDSVPLF